MSIGVSCDKGWDCVCARTEGIRLRLITRINKVLNSIKFFLIFMREHDILKEPLKHPKERGEVTNLKTLHKEIDEIKADLGRILFILENEGEVKEEMLKELERARSAPKEEYISHERVKRALMK